MADITTTFERIGATAALEAVWRTAGDRAGGSFFTSWPWVENWIEINRSRREISLLLASRGGEPLGCALWAFARGVRHGFVRSCGLHLLETADLASDAVRVEHNRLLAAPGAQAEVRAVLLQHLTTRVPEVNEIYFPGISSLELQGDLRSCGRPDWSFHELKREPYFVVDLEKLREKKTGFLEQLESSLRYRIRKALRVLGGELLLQRPRDCAEAQEFFSLLKEWHTRRWEGSASGGSFQYSNFEPFHRRLIEKHWHSGALDLLKVSAGGSVLGVLYNFKSDVTISFYQSGINYADPKVNPGMLCHVAAVEHYLKEGVHRYDLLSGDSRYKRDLAEVAGEMVWGVLRKDSWQFRLEHWLRDVKGRLRGCKTP